MPPAFILRAFILAQVELLANALCDLIASMARGYENARIRTRVRTRKRIRMYSRVRIRVCARIRTCTRI